MDSSALDVLRKHRGRFVTLCLAIVVALLVGVAPMFADGSGGGMSCCVGDGGGKSMSGSSEAGNGGGNKPDGGNGAGAGAGNRNDVDRDTSSRGRSTPLSNAGAGTLSRVVSPAKSEPSHFSKEVRRAIEYMADNPDVGNGNEVTGADGYELGVAASNAYQGWSEKKAREYEQREATEKAEREAAAARAVADAKALAERLKEEQQKREQKTQDQPIIQH